MPIQPYRSGTGRVLPSGPDAGLPRPRSSHGGTVKAICWAFVSVAVLGAACFWLTRAPGEKEALREEAANAVNNALAGTPLAGVGIMIGASTPPPAPPEVLNPPTDAGTLAGRQVTGTIAAPMDFGPILPRQSELSQPQGPRDSSSQNFKEDLKDAVAGVAGMLGAEDNAPKVVFNQDYVDPVTEDSRVRPSYLANLAQWLVNHYKPGPGEGSLGVNVQALNQECGVRLAAQAQGGRSGLLRYAMQPAMIDGLYKLYIDRFMQDLNEAAQRKGLDEAQNRAFHAALAGRAALLASSLEAVLQVPDLAASLDRIDSLARKTVDENAELTTAVFELDEIKPGSSQARATAQMRVDGASARYRRASEAHADAQRHLAREIRKYAGPGLDDESLLFMAAWVGRREEDGAQARPALSRCAAILHDLAARCRLAGGR